MDVSEIYLTVSEVATLLKVSPKRVQNMMCAGIFTEGLHFFRPAGYGRGSTRRRFK